MKGYPKFFATKEDYENIMRDFPEWRGKVKKELSGLAAIDDDKVYRATTLKDPAKPELGYNVVEVTNSFPMFKQRGFKNRKEISTLIEMKKAVGEQSK